MEKTTKIITVTMCFDCPYLDCLKSNYEKDVALKYICRRSGRLIPYADVFEIQYFCRLKNKEV